jgi:ABC-type nitrate/sulfonate/bicarbonate transport system substrate-binding protein
MKQTKIAIAHAGAISPISWILRRIAQEQGLFTKYGLEAQLIGGSTGAIRSVGKETEFGSFGTGATLLEIAQQGTDLKMLGTFTTGRISSHLVTRAEIKKPEDLRGKRFGVGTMGSGIWVNTILALQHLGLDPKRDNITILSVGNATQIAKALEDGAIDAAMLAPAQSRQMKSKGFSVLLDMYSNNVYGPQNLLSTTGAYFREHSDVVEKVVTTLVEAMAFSLAPKNKPTVLRTIMKAFDLADLAAAERGYEDLRDLNRKPYPTVERLKSMQRVMALHEPKVLGVKVEDVIEDRFVRKLDESGTIGRLYNTYGVK